MREKHLFKLASLLIAMLMGLAMVMSCSKDDGDDNNNNNGGNSSSSSGGSSSSGIPTGTYECYSCDGEGICTLCNGTGRSGSYECWACNGTGRCSICDGRGYLYSNNSGGSSSGGSSSGGSSSGGSSSSSGSSTTRTCAVCLGTGKCISPSNDKYHCRGTGKCQTCSGKGYYYGFSYENIMCPNCDVPGHGNTPGNGKCGFCGGSGQCKYCNGKGHK